MTLLQRWKQTALHNKALVLTGVIVAFGTLVSTIIVIVQVCIMSANNRNTSEQVSKLIRAANIQACAATRNATSAASFSSSAEGINAETQLAVVKFDRMAKASEQSASAALQSARTAQDSFLAENNPLVITHYESGFIPVMPNTEIKEPLQFVNVGKTPATNFQMYVVLDVLPVTELPTFDYSPGHVRAFIETGLLYPNDPKTGSVSVLEKGPAGPHPLIITKPMFDDFEAARSYIVLHGRMTYGDMFGGKQQIGTFCSIRMVGGWVIPKDLADTCSAYNQIKFAKK